MKYEKPPTYALRYYVGGQIKETIITGALSLCRWKMRDVKSTGNYKDGILKIEYVS